MLEIDTITVQHLADGDYKLSWKASQPNTTVAVALVDEHCHDIQPIPVIETRENRARLRDLAVDKRHLFHIADEQGNERVVAHRHIKMKGTPNFRDFGGYQTEDGRTVKWGYLFRSGQLSKLNENDQQLFSDLKIDLVCDFRREIDQLDHPSRIPVNASPHIAGLYITPGSLESFIEGPEANVGVKPGFDFMVEMNRSFALEQRVQYSAMFEEMLAANKGRTLVHCAVGKDRSGFAAAIILLALGVPRDVVMADYLLTAEYFRYDRETKSMIKKYGLSLNAVALQPMLEVHPEYLQAAFNAIDENFGSIDSYLAEHLGLSFKGRAKLKSMYLL